jgi:pimeloyl-ACP methyl ester carboxylesterase
MVDDARTEVSHGHVAAADGVRIAWTLEARPGRGHVVIVCPGFFKSKDTPTFEGMRRALAADTDILTMDFRGHGRSEGAYTFSSRERADLEAVLSLAQARYARIGVLGFSMGAAIAINTISRQPGGVCSLISVGGPSSFDEIEFRWWTSQAIRNGLEGLERGAGFRPGPVWLAKERPIDRIADCRVPILIVHGDQDQIVGVEHARRLYPAAGMPKALQIVPGGSHAEALFRRDPDGFLGLIRPWLKSTLTAQT